MMPYLDAALAFALTMLAIASLVTQIVRFFKNTATVRQAGMQKMLKEYFDSEFQPVVQRELNRLQSTVNKRIVTELNDALVKFDKTAELQKAEAEKLVDMTTDELLERLKRSELGQKMLTGLGDKAQAVFDELGKRYEVIGKKATESFRKDSAKWAFAIALILALVLNVDSLYIANTYINNANLTQAVIAQKEAFVEDYDTLAAALEKEQGQETFTKAELEQAFQDSREQLKVVTTAGFPIGWSYFPHSYFLKGVQLEPKVSQDYENRNNLLGWISWAVGIFLTGVLAGRGGPFWYDIVAGVSRVVQGTRAAAKKPEQ